MTGTLDKKAMLVDLMISQVTRTKTDKRLTAETTILHKANASSAKLIKRLFAADSTAKCDSLIRQIGDLHKALTLPWTRAGMGILSTANFTEYTTRIRALMVQLSEEAEVFACAQEKAHQKAKEMLGDMYDPADYPTPDEVRNGYKVRIQFFPVPTAGDFRCEIGEQDMAIVRSEIEAEVQASMASAVKTLLAEVLEQLTSTTEKIYTGDVTAGTIKAINKKLEAAVKLNIAGDPKLDNLLADMCALFANTDAAELRENSSVNENILDKADAIAADLEDYMAVL